MTVRYRQTSSVSKVIPITNVNQGTKQRNIFSFTPRPFYPRENSPRNSLSTRLDATVWFQRGNHVTAMQSLDSSLLLRERNLRAACSVADTYERCEGSSAPPSVNHSSTLKMDAVRSMKLRYPKLQGITWQRTAAFFSLPCRYPRIIPSIRLHNVLYGLTKFSSTTSCGIWRRVVWQTVTNF